MLWLFVGPTGVYLLDFFCSGIQFNLLFSLYPCFISLLYLDLYVLGDEVGAPFNWLKTSSKIFLLTVPRWCYFCGSFVFFSVLFCYAFMHVCLLMPCGHLLGKG